MNRNLKDLGRQLKEIWSQLGLNQKISIVLAGGVVLIGLGLLTFFSSRTSYQLLYSRLDANEVAKALAVLEENAVPFKTSASGSAIYVPGAQVNAMRMKLAGTITGGDVVGDELLDRANPMMSDKLQDAQLERARRGELSRTISSLDDIESARVDVAMVSNSLLRGPDERSTASVFVKVRGNRRLTREVVSSITSIVANSLGIKPSDVALIDNLGNNYTTGEGDGVLGAAGGYLAKQQEAEKYFSDKVVAMLDRVLGPGQATVAVAVELKTDDVSLTARSFDPNKVLRQETTSEETTESMTGGSGGGNNAFNAPGITTNLGGFTNSVSSAPSYNQNTTTVKTTDVINEVGEIVSRTNQYAGGFKRISAAVMINQRMDGTGPDAQPIKRSQEELDNLRLAIQSALGLQPEGDGLEQRNDEITLVEMPFNFEPIAEMNMVLDQQQKKHFWLNLIGKSAYPALALVVLFLFWRAFRNTRVEKIPLGVPVGQLDDHGAMSSSIDWGDNNGAKVVSVDVLNRLVKDNPGNMTQAIRNWLGTDKKNGN